MGTKIGMGIHAAHRVISSGQTVFLKGQRVGRRRFAGMQTVSITGQQVSSSGQRVSRAGQREGSLGHSVKILSEPKTQVVGTVGHFVCTYSRGQSVKKMEHSVSTPLGQALGIVGHSVTMGGQFVRDVGQMVKTGGLTVAKYSLLSSAAPDAGMVATQTRERSVAMDFRRIIWG